jgi:translation initiation factor 2B subunit (eIF-2B alpha/beta/delta family)
VTPKGVVNKIGTYGLAIAAKELSLPFYCVCESTKFVPDLLPLDKLNKPQPESQLFNTDYKGDRPNNLKVENIYFDFTPMKYVTGFLTDKGRMSKNQVRKYIKEINLLTTLI